MPSAYKEFSTQIESLKADLHFVRLASQLRPRIWAVIRWDASEEERNLATQFSSIDMITPEEFYGPLLVRLLAAVERLLRSLVGEAIYRKTAAAKTYDDLSDGLKQRNIVLSGRLLASLDSPKDYLTPDYEDLINNLASCKKGQCAFKLNAQAFGATIESVSTASIDKAFDHMDITQGWDRLGADPQAAALLGTKGARSTGTQLKQKLRELARWRNHLAHGGDGSLMITDAQLQEAIDIVSAFGRTLNGIVQSI
jgi:hypothetical protein